MESKELAIRLARALDAKKAVNVHILAAVSYTHLVAVVGRVERPAVEQCFHFASTAV